jgi:hypothetical protein
MRRSIASQEEFCVVELVETMPSNVQGDSRILKFSFSGGKGCRSMMLSTHLHLMLTFTTLYTFMERYWNKVKAQNTGGSSIYTQCTDPKTAHN